MESERLAQLAKMVVARRKARGWPTRQAFAENIALDYRVLTDLENGVRRLGGKSYAAVEAALLWNAGGIDRYLSSGDLAELDSMAAPPAEPAKAEFSLSVTPTLGGPPSIARLAQDSLVKVYLASQQRPAADRAELFLDELFRAINLCRTVVVNDPDQTVRANAADVLAYAEAAAGFLKMTIAEIKGERHVVATAQESPASSEASSHEKTDAEDRSADNSQSRTAFDDLDAATDGAISELDVDGVDDDGQQFG